MVTLRRSCAVQENPMETPQTPLEFLRRARKVHPHRQAVVDGELRFDYATFGDRCDRASAA
jgi:fatty-acyl-CoA synthase